MPPCEGKVCLLLIHHSGPDGRDISDQVCKSPSWSSERGLIVFWGLPEEVVYNLIVLKEKSIFQAGRPGYVCASAQEVNQGSGEENYGSHCWSLTSELTSQRKQFSVLECFCSEGIRAFLHSPPPSPWHCPGPGPLHLSPEPEQDLTAP